MRYVATLLALSGCAVFDAPVYHAGDVVWLCYTGDCHKNLDPILKDMEDPIFIKSICGAGAMTAICEGVK